MLDFDAIPLGPKDLPQWCVYKLEDVDGEITTVPYSPTTGQRASSTDRLTWSTFNAALAAYQDREGYDGICFILCEENGIVFIDLDDCIKDGVIEQWALEIVKRFNSYTEQSQRGNGLHILIKRTKPGNRCRTAKYPHTIVICTPIRQEVWSIVRPFLVHLIAHLAMFCLAEVSLAFMLILTCGMLFFCDCLFGGQEIYIKIMCVTVEVILTLYFVKFTPFKTPRVTPF